MGFQFSLHAVLQFRENAEKQEEARLQQVLAEIVRGEDEVERLAVHMRETTSRRSQVLADSASAMHLQILEGEIEETRRRQHELKLHILALEQKKAQQLVLYHKKRTDRNILDEMHKQQRQAFDKVQSVQEQKRLDDIFAARTQRD